MFRKMRSLSASMAALNPWTRLSSCRLFPGEQRGGGGKETRPRQTHLDACTVPVALQHEEEHPRDRSMQRHRPDDVASALPAHGCPCLHLPDLSSSVRL